MRYPVLFGLLCALVGAWVNNEIVPRGHEVRRSLKSRVSVDTGLDLLEPGIWINDFPKVKIYFGSKDGNWLHDLMVIDYSSDVTRTIRAAKARVESEGRDIKLDLYSLTVDPLDADHPGMARISRYEYTVKDALAETKFTKKGKDMRFGELTAKIRDLGSTGSAELAKAEAQGDDDAKKLKKDIKRSRSKLKTELSKRFVFAAASFCFVLVGIPLGIRSQRKESSIGMAISLGIAISYYLLVMLMLSLQKSYTIHPEILIFAPVAISLLLAVRFISKNR